MPSCKEGALAVVETPSGRKARLVKDIYCDGLGACIGECPQGALTIEKREAPPFDERAVKDRQTKLHATHAVRGCPGMRAVSLAGEKSSVSGSSVRRPSQLRQWPVQITLIPPSAPYLKNADILICADCVPFAYPGLHDDFLKDRIVLVGCPKFDDAGAHVEKLAEIITEANPKSITVLHMEVPCCFGLVNVVEEAIKRSGRKLKFEEVVIGISGSKQ